MVSTPPPPRGGGEPSSLGGMGMGGEGTCCARPVLLCSYACFVVVPWGACRGFLLPTLLRAPRWGLAEGGVGGTKGLSTVDSSCPVLRVCQWARCS